MLLRYLYPEILLIGDFALSWPALCATFCKSCCTHQHMLILQVCTHTYHSAASVVLFMSPSNSFNLWRAEASAATLVCCSQPSPRQHWQHAQYLGTQPISARLQAGCQRQAIRAVTQDATLKQTMHQVGRVSLTYHLHCCLHCLRLCLCKCQLRLACVSQRDPL